MIATMRSLRAPALRVPALRLTVLLVGLLSVFAARVNAGLLDPNHLPTFTMTAEGSPNPWTWTPPVSAFELHPEGYQLRNVYQANGVCDDRADIKVDLLRFNPDPFVLNNVLVTNTTTSTQIFSAFVGLPTTFAAPNLISGTINTSIIEGGTDSATIATVSPTAIYQAQIDFVTVATLQNHPFSLTTTSATSSLASFGPIVSAVPVTSNIGIQLRFSLSPGDTASILSRFDVVAVPEPASAAFVGTMLVLTGTTGTFSRGRRRHA